MKDTAATYEYKFLTSIVNKCMTVFYSVYIIDHSTSWEYSGLNVSF